MPSQVRIISGPRNTSFDHFIQDIVDKGNFEVEHTYFGIKDLERAMFVRNKLNTAGKHMDPVVAVKAFRQECQGCAQGGPDCRFHVSYTCYDMEKARAYKEKQKQYASGH